MGKINDALPKKQERKKQEKEKKRPGRVRKKKGRKEKRKKKEKGKEAQSFGGTTDAVAEGLGLLEATA